MKSGKLIKKFWELNKKSPLGYSVVAIYLYYIDFLIKEKYNTWKNNDWKNKYGKPIRNWQTTLKTSLPYMLTSTNNSFIGNIPRIKRPK